MNTYWRRVGYKTLISRGGREFRKNVCAMLAGDGPRKPPAGGRIALLMDAFPPDRRRRDLDNLQKPTLDAMQHAEVFTDDAIVWDLHLRWDVSETGEIITWPHGRVHVRIERFEKLPGQLF